MGHGRKAYIARELLSISEVTVEDLARKHGCEVVADAINPAQCCDLCGDRIARRGGEMFIALDIQLADQISDENEATA
jgi:hypothetical protein